MSTDELKDTARRIIRAALEAADPAAAVSRALAATPRGFLASGSPFPVEGRLVLVAVGKAAAAMTRGALGILGERVTGGIVVLPHGYPADIGGQAAGRIQVVAAGHPVPDEGGLRAARGVLDLVEAMQERDTCLFLLSGGGSSLLPMPAPPITLEDKMRTTRLLLQSGADIREINTVRKHISAIKGGQLAARCRGRIATLVISDVVGDPLEFIASGPTVPDTTSWEDARDVLARYSLAASVPVAVARRIEQGVAGELPETPKSLPARHAVSVIASNTRALEAAAAEASATGFAPFVLTRSLTGEARRAGRWIAAAAREVRERESPSSHLPASSRAEKRRSPSGVPGPAGETRRSPCPRPWTWPGSRGSSSPPLPRTAGKATAMRQVPLPRVRRSGPARCRARSPGMP